MLHPDLARALAAAHIEDLHRAAARRHTIRLARRVAHEQGGDQRRGTRGWFHRVVDSDYEPLDRPRAGPGPLVGRNRLNDPP